MIAFFLPVMVGVGLGEVAETPSFQVHPPRISTSYGLLTEGIGAEALQVRVEGLVSVGVEVDATLGDWALPVHFGQQGYQFANPDYPGLLHQRQITVFALAVERRYPWGALAMASGIGYQGRWGAISSTAEPPTQPAPSTFWFSPVMSLHGVELRQQVAVPLHPLLGIGLDLRWTPVLALTAEGPTMPWLTRLSFEPRLTMGASRGLSLSGFADAIFDPGSLGGGFHQVQTGFGLRYDFGPMGRDPEDAR